MKLTILPYFSSIRLLPFIKVMSLCLITQLCFGELTAPTGPAKPTQAHLNYQENPLSVFFHMNTTFPLSSMTWHNFDAADLLDTVEAFGAARVVVVVKHADGFLWYPTTAPRPADKGTDRWNPNGSMRSTRGIAWKNGEGDVLKEIADEARARGIGLGIYYNMTDDSQDVVTSGIAEGARVTQAAYNEYVRKSFTDILTKYGPLDELWFDGNVTKQIADIIDPLIAEHQPNVAVQQGRWGQSLVKWSGDERGTFRYPGWNGNVVPQARYGEVKVGNQRAPGFEVLRRDNHQRWGDPKGNVWIPIEVDIRGTSDWFGGPPVSFDWLLGRYYNVVGKGGALLVNFPVRHDGTHDPRVVDLAEKVGDRVHRDIGYPLHDKILDKSGSTWTVDLGKTITADRLVIREQIKHGERILQAKVEGYDPDASRWNTLATFSAVGSKQIREFAAKKVSRVRFTATRTQNGTPEIKDFYLAKAGVVDTSAPSVPANLRAEAKSDSEVMLTWDASSENTKHSRVGYYEVYKDGVSLGRSSARRTPLQQRVTGLAESTEHTFKIRAVNIFAAKSGFSHEVSATTLADTIAPKVLSAGLVVNNATVDILFSEPVERVSAETAANYAISPRVAVTSAVLKADKRTVRLSLAKDLKSLGKYQLTVSNVRDLATVPNFIASGENQVDINTHFGLLRYYNLDEGSGSEISNSGIIGGSSQVNSPRWVDGHVGDGALEFNGSSTYSKLAVDIRPDNSFTLAAWVFPTERRRHSILTEEKSGLKELQFRFQIESDNSLFFRHSDQGEANYQIRSGSNTVPLNTWTHVAVRYDTDKLEYSLFINGAKVTSPSISKSATRVTRPDNPAPGLLGAITNRQNDGGVHTFFKGKMDEVYIYGLPLPDEAIRNLSRAHLVSRPALPYNSFNNKLTRYFRLDGAQADYSAQLVNTQEEVNGKIDKAVRFNGASSRVELKNLTLPDTSSNFTISAWVHPTATRQQIILAQDRAGETNNQWRLTLEGGNRLVFYITDSTNGESATVRGGVALAGRWTHVVIQNDVSKQQLTLFVDGEVAGRSNYTNAVVRSTESLPVTTIGARFKRGGSAHTDETFNGLIDDLRIHDRGSFITVPPTSWVKGLYEYQGGGVATRGKVHHTSNLLDYSARWFRTWKKGGWRIRAMEPSVELISGENGEALKWRVVQASRRPKGEPAQSVELMFKGRQVRVFASGYHESLGGRLTIFLDSKKAKVVNLGKVKQNKSVEVFKSKKLDPTTTHHLKLICKKRKCGFDFIEVR